MCFPVPRSEGRKCACWVDCKSSTAYLPDPVHIAFNSLPLHHAPSPLPLAHLAFTGFIKWPSSFPPWGLVHPMFIWTRKSPSQCGYNWLISDGDSLQVMASRKLCIFYLKWEFLAHSYHLFLVIGPCLISSLSPSLFLLVRDSLLILAWPSAPTLLPQPFKHWAYRQITTPHFFNFHFNSRLGVIVSSPVCSFAWIKSIFLNRAGICQEPWEIPTKQLSPRAGLLSVPIWFYYFTLPQLALSEASTRV